MSLLGIDVGTTGSKVSVFSSDGCCLASAYREYTAQNTADGWVELDSHYVLALIKEAIAEVAHRTTTDPIGALAVSSMGEAMTPLSHERTILGPSILMADIRGGEFIDLLREQLGQERFYAINPNLLGTQYSLPKLLWLQRYRPQIYEQTTQFLLWGDLVAVMLGCEPVTSYSLANRTLLFDLRQEDWSEQLLDLTGLDREKLPPVRPSGTIIGTVHDTMAEELGLPKGVQVILGGHDQCCNCLGAGIYRAGKAVCGIGTYECITPVFDHIPDLQAMRTNGLNIEHHVLSRLFVSFIYNQGGSLVRWFRDTFTSADVRLSQSESIYELLAAEMPSEPTSLLVLPYFEATGPPHFVSDAAGVIAGLKLTTTRGEILKAIMEGVSFYFIASVAALTEMEIDTSEFIATGGGARSDSWLQIQADVFGIPFVRPRITECSTLGAAMLAGIATGVFSSPAQAVSALVQRERVFEPDIARHQRYSEKLGAYQQWLSATRGKV